MSEIERKLDAVMRAIAGATTSDRNAATQEIRTYLESGGSHGGAETDVQTEIERLLLELGVPCRIKGYDYLLAAIGVAVENPQSAQAVIKELYHPVAKSFQSTPARVERGIRHAIETGWDRCDSAVTTAYFGNTVSPLKGKPTNSEFITQVAKIVRRRVGK